MHSNISNQTVDRQPSLDGEMVISPLNPKSYFIVCIEWQYEFELYIVKYYRLVWLIELKDKNYFHLASIFWPYRNHRIFFYYLEDTWFSTTFHHWKSANIANIKHFKYSDSRTGRTNWKIDKFPIKTTVQKQFPVHDLIKFNENSPRIIK